MIEAACEVIGRHMILFCPRNSSKNVMTIPTTSLVVGFCMFLLSCLSVQLVRTSYGLSVRSLWLVHVVYRPVCTKHPNPKAGRSLDTDKPRCITSGRGGETDPQISCLFLMYFCLQPPTFAADHRVGLHWNTCISFWNLFVSGI